MVDEVQQKKEKKQCKNKFPYEKLRVDVFWRVNLLIFKTKINNFLLLVGTFCDAEHKINASGLL